MSEMQERIAHAISPLMPDCAGAICVFTPRSDCLCGRVALRAIATMREPTEVMKKAGGELLCDGYIPPVIAQDNAAGIWREMIRAALTTDVKA